MDNLRLIVMENIKDLGEKVNSHLKNMLGTTKDLIVPVDEVRFNNGEGKIVLKESVRKKDIFIIYFIVSYLFKRGKLWVNPLPDSFAPTVAMPRENGWVNALTAENGIAW